MPSKLLVPPVAVLVSAPCVTWVVGRPVIPLRAILTGGPPFPGELHLAHF